MKLCEDLQDDVISKFQLVLDTYKDFKEILEDFSEACSENKYLVKHSKYLLDFYNNEFDDELQDMKTIILDEYYPIDYGDSEEDEEIAAEIYKDSKENRENIFH